MTSKKLLSETDIRTKYITPALKKAGWKLESQIQRSLFYRGANLC